MQYQHGFPMFHGNSCIQSWECFSTSFKSKITFGHTRWQIFLFSCQLPHKSRWQFFKETFVYSRSYSWVNPCKHGFIIVHLLWAKNHLPPAIFSLISCQTRRKSLILGDVLLKCYCQHLILVKIRIYGYFCTSPHSLNSLYALEPIVWIRCVLSKKSSPESHPRFCSQTRTEVSNSWWNTQYILIPASHFGYNKNVHILLHKSWQFYQWTWMLTYSMKGNYLSCQNGYQWLFFFTHRWHCRHL